VFTGAFVAAVLGSENKRRRCYCVN